ncbi:hypothetical protein Trydic_g11344 [Trypoxylus dichotomus]
MYKRVDSSSGIVQSIVAPRALLPFRSNLLGCKVWQRRTAERDIARPDLTAPVLKHTAYIGSWLYAKVSVLFFAVKGVACQKRSTWIADHCRS